MKKVLSTEIKGMNADVDLRDYSEGYIEQSYFRKQPSILFVLPVEF
ncbi:hypothetical protein IFO69_09215 [Echinicola sp. CAU 1574]|uniref:Uncharacterized protein n=1 Tax=Echinicola arenosa TaxID=2774144 RepID=A0ABR9AJC0_9BACT|nr:hypothetical protein [Echinicola arenosa]MBD8488922.1 hypothetical protein [Echinicola arenosa]